MRKLILVLVFLIGTLMLVAAMDQSFINRLKQDRYFAHLLSGKTKPKSLYQRIFVRSDRWRYGDLYGLSYLPAYKFGLAPFKEYTGNNGHLKKNRNLYIIGDSFLADKTLNGAFDEFDNVTFLDRRFPFGPIVLDSTRQNYLIMEFAERNLNGYAITNTDETRWSAEDLRSGLNFNKNLPAGQFNKTAPASLFSRLNAIIFSKDMSRNLELILFDDRVFTPIKEAKATLNYALFGRVAKEVAVSSKKDRLFLNSTVDTASLQSAFRLKPDAEINQICANLNDAGSYYRSIGFKKVHLSVIPNPVSLYDSTRMPYNHLLERVEKKTTLPLISVFNIYKNSDMNLYYRSDAHWNPSGLDVWVKKAGQAFQTDLDNTKNMRNKK
jgi:hypothetical protein